MVEWMLKRNRHRVPPPHIPAATHLQDRSAPCETTNWLRGSQATPCTYRRCPSSRSRALLAPLAWGSQNMHVMSLEAVTKPDPSAAQHMSTTSSPVYDLRGRAGAVEVDEEVGRKQCCIVEGAGLFGGGWERGR